MNKPLTPAERTARWRAKMRAQGLRPKQIWVPDVHSPEFKAEARRESLLIAQAMKKSDDLDFAAAVQFWPEDEED